MAKESRQLSIIPAAAVFDRRLSHADIRVLAALGAHADKQGRCWPAVSTLAQKIGLSERHVRRCLQTLSKCGVVEIQKRLGRSSIYRIPMTWVSGVEG
jgi:predicted transcriptional regulator